MSLAAFLLSAPWIILAVLAATDMDSDCLNSTVADVGIGVSVAGGGVATLAVLASFSKRSRHLAWPLLVVFVMLAVAWLVIVSGCG